MTISRIGKLLSIITSVLATVFGSLLAVCCFHTGSANGSGQLGDYLKYLTLPALLTLVFLALLATISVIAAKNKQHQKKSNREILSVYEAIYKIRTLGAEKDKKFHGIIKTRNIIDLVACQLALLCYILAADYLLFVAKFTGESIDADLRSALTVVLPVTMLGTLILIIRDLVSEKQSSKAIKLIEGDHKAKKVLAVLKKSDVTESFFRFKAKINSVRLIKSIMLGLGFGLASFGACWMLSKQCIVSLEDLISIVIGGGVGLVVFAIFFLIGRKNNMDIACQLDEEFDLKARVQTMVEFSEDDGELAQLQRLDTEKTLSEISTRSYKFKKLWAYILVVALGAAALAGGFIITDMRGYVPPEQVEAFELSPLQEAGLNELIAYVNGSSLEDEFKEPMVQELKLLLDDLRVIKTKPEMQAALVKTMANLTAITYESSTATEMLNALWDSEDVYFRYLAVVLDTSSWSSPDWGDFAEKTDEYVAILLGEGDETPGATIGAPRAKSAIDSMMRKLDVVLSTSGLPEDDEMYVAVNNLFRNQLVGLALAVPKADSLSDEQMAELLRSSLNIMSEDTFAAISLNRTNAVVGEYTMTRLSSLFGVPVPQFERPDFVRNGESPEINHGGGEEDKNNNNSGNTDGGAGEGATFGSDDLVLDPLTGKYVKYGEIYHQYYTLMYEKLQSDFYTEEQKQAIMKYFELLYSGLKKEEGK